MYCRKGLIDKGRLTTAQTALVYQRDERQLNYRIQLSCERKGIKGQTN